MTSTTLPDPMLPSAADVALIRGQGAAQHHRDTMKAAAAAGDHASVRKTAETFEGQFISQMLGHMFKGLKSDGMFGGGQAESMWRDFYVAEVGQVIARRGGIGVAEAIERQLLQLQEVSR